MSYVLDLFTPKTWKAFREHGSTVTGFRPAHRARAQNLVKPGDLFICYLVRLSRWCGLLEAVSDYYEDSTPIFRPDDDPWTIRFKVKPIVVLEEGESIPIRLPEVWNTLSRTRSLQQNSVAWPGKAALQSSLVRISTADGDFLSDQLRRQAVQRIVFPLSESDKKELTRSEDVVKGTTGAVTVIVPETTQVEPERSSAHQEDVRDSIRKQAQLVEIGVKMGFDVWIPRADRARVERELTSDVRLRLLDSLPVNFDRATFRTIENIDVLWLRKRTLLRAFEVEHTTAVYSGLLRMADLLALQPNIDIKLHIVAPHSRRDKVIDEIQRPAFALMDKALPAVCSFLSYEALDELASQEHLAHMNDSVLEEYEEVPSGVDRT
jgi:hypothetical protein